MPPVTRHPGHFLGDESFLLPPESAEDAVKSQTLGVVDIDAAWERTLVVSTRYQLLVSAVLTLAALLVGYIILSDVPVWAFLAVLAWVAFSTLVLAWLSTRSTRQALEDRLYLRVGLIVSVLTITLVTYLVGEASGDFYLVYFLPLITAGVYFSLRGGLITAVTSTVSYIGLAYVTVPVDPALLRILAIRVCFFFVIACTIGLLTEGQRYLLQGLRSAYLQATRLALIDPLTGIYNRRYLTIRLAEEMAELRRYGDSVALLLIDVDFFKQYNDRLGHLAGDEALQAIARVFRDSCRSADIVGRFGGDEFAVVLPHTTAEQAEALGGRICHLAVESLGRGDEGKERLSLSIGVAASPEHAEVADELWVRADEALYGAKQAGRNAVARWEPHLAEIRAMPTAAPRPDVLPAPVPPRDLS